MFMCLLEASPYRQREDVSTYLVRLFGEPPEQLVHQDPWSGKYTYHNFEQGASGILNGEIISLHRLMRTLVAAYVNGEVLPEDTKKINKAVRRTVQIVKDIGSTTYFGTGSTKLWVKHDWCIRTMLYRPRGEMTLTGAEIYAMIREMRGYYRKRESAAKRLAAAAPTVSE